MKDRMLVCSSCGIRFVWTAWEQRQAALRGEDAPSQCPGCRALELLVSEHVGKVRRYSPKRGWGFIRMESGKDVFVHRSALKPPLRTLRAGQSVRFRLAADDKGLRAESVRPRRARD